MPKRPIPPWKLPELNRNNSALARQLKSLPGGTSIGLAPGTVYGVLWHLLGWNHLTPLWLELYEGYAWFVAAFRQAAEKLKAGDRSAAFPTGSFPPALPFVGG
jgi:hypothetical protein